MQALVIGARQQSGIGKESGKPYSISPKVLIAQVATSVDTDRLKIVAWGSEAMELDCTPEAFSELQKLHPLRVYELDTALTKRGDSVVSTVISFKAKQAA